MAKSVDTGIHDALEDYLRRALVLTIGLAMAFFIAPIQAQAAEFDPWEMSFPVDGDYNHLDNFGDCRGSSCSRSHEGNDIMADKGVPVIAVADGVVTWFPDSQTECCYVGIDHGSGWYTRYIHMNNDTPGTDDGQYWGIAEGIAEGVEVTQGQLIGWVGDSGNAEWTASHLHFELRRYSGSQWNSWAIDPWDYLKQAESRPLVYNGQFYDDDGLIHENDIELIYASGITKGCNPPTNNRYCVDDSVSRGAMAAFINRALGLPVAQQDYFDDDTGNTFENDINAITEAGIGFGCSENSYCPDDPLLREEFAELFTRAFGYTNPEGTDWFTDDDGSQYEESINALKVAGVTKGCNPPENDRFCPSNPVDRAAMASFFVRALDL